MDYRNTEYCPRFENIKEKKEVLEASIKEKHKKAKIIYNHIKKYLREFSKIYNFKCAYCGASEHFLDSRLFEVDHFICESTFSSDLAGRAEAGKLCNLVYSCYTCNRGKSDFLILNEYKNLFDPDDLYLPAIFCRCDDFSIIINQEYAENNVVKSFYESLKLEYQVRRLEHLLIEMDGLKGKMPKEAADKLGHAISKLMQKKNAMY